MCYAAIPVRLIAMKEAAMRVWASRALVPGVLLPLVSALIIGLCVSVGCNLLGGAAILMAALVRRT
jgi:hypothetical protein